MIIAYLMNLNYSTIHENIDLIWVFHFALKNGCDTLSISPEIS